MKHIAFAVLLASLCAALPSARGDEEAMKRGMARWEQQLQEYHAALTAAATDEERAKVQMPDGRELAEELWHSISRKTGTKEVQAEPGKGSKPRTVSTYEFEEPWAAPAVVWFVNRPEALAQLYAQKPRQLSFFANALLDALENVHYKSPSMADACAKLASEPSVRSYELVRKTYLHNQDPAARGCAALALSLMLNDPLISSREGNRTELKRSYYLKQSLTLSPEGTLYAGSPIEVTAMEQTYRLRYLSQGCIPPCFKARQTGGAIGTFPEPGQPTLLFFWSPEESVGISIMQKQEALLKKYPGLVFCPITAAEDMETLNGLMADHHIAATWLDDAKHAISHAYRIPSPPWAVLLDDHCAILYYGYPDLKLQTALDEYFQKKAQPQKAQVSPGRGSIYIKETEEAPLIQPGSQPKPAAEEVPALRDIPEF